MSASDASALSLLNSVFGLKAYRGEQEKIVRHVTQGGNCLVLMPTGGGKSLCYQLPSLLREGCGIVVSPLIALMRDQVAGLVEAGVNAAMLNSTLSPQEANEVERRLIAGDLDLLYVAPERLLMPRCLSLLEQANIALFAIDEAHCVSQWGHDFRPEYIGLSVLAERFPEVPGLALVSGNVANAETPGYVRRTLNQETIATGSNGSSVRVAGVTRELDQYLQRQLRTETSGGAYADLRSQFYQRLQSVYGDPGSSASLETVYSKFTDALQALSVSPDDFSARTGVINAAQVLAQQLNGLSTDVQGLRSDAEQGLADSVRTANTAMTRIAEINQQLANSSTTDAANATLIDQRDGYIDQLSQLMDIRVTTDDANRVMIFTGSGTQLVGTQAARLNFDFHGTITATSKWSADPTERGVGTLTLSTATGGTIDLITNKAIRSGQIAAYLEMRDQVLPQAQSQLDQLAASMSQALSDRTVDGAAAPTTPPQVGFNVDVGGLAAGNTIQLTYTDTTTSTQKKFTFVRVDDPSVLPLSDKTTADPNDTVIGLDWTGGLPSVINQLNAKFFSKLTVSNPSGNLLQVVDNGGNTSTLNALSATTTVQTLTGNVPQLPLFRDGTQAFTGEIDSNGRQIDGYAGRISVNALLA